MMLTLAFNYGSFFLFLSTVKVVLLPVGQEIVIPFKVNTVVNCLKDHFSSLLGVPAFVLQIRCAGKLGG